MPMGSFNLPYTEAPQTIETLRETLPPIATIKPIKRSVVHHKGAIPTNTHRYGANQMQEGPF
jgi:hypothetical protein